MLTITVYKTVTAGDTSKFINEIKCASKSSAIPINQSFPTLQKQAHFESVPGELSLLRFHKHSSSLQNHKAEGNQSGMI